MAFNMYYKNGVLRKKRCQISDEMIRTLYQIHQRSEFPKLTWLIDHLYDSPKISPIEAQLLAEEIVAFEGVLLSLSLPFPMVALQQLHSFFQAAADKQQVISTGMN